jgi:hypothetical protein
MAIVAGAAAHAANGANDNLLSASPKVQATILAKAVGPNCRGRTVFYMGIGKSGSSQNKGYWSVQCTTGRSFLVQVNPNGTSEILECSKYMALITGTCFRKLSDQ